jgi:hypothetical protein
LDCFFRIEGVDHEELFLRIWVVAAPAQQENSKKAKKTAVQKFAAHRCVVCGCCQCLE